MKKFFKKYWASITLFSLTVFAIISIFIWTDYTDALTAFVSVSIPTAILSIEMRKNKEQFRASIELDRINNIRCQGAIFMEALNDNEFVKLNNEFIKQYSQILHNKEFKAEKLSELVKPISDHCHLEWLKLKMLIPNDKEGIKVKNELYKIKTNVELVLQKFQNVICFIDCKTKNELTLEDFNEYISEITGEKFDLIYWIWQIDNSNTLKSAPPFDANNYTEPPYYYIALYVTNLLGTPSKIWAPVGIEESAIKLVTDYCNLKEEEL